MELPQAIEILVKTNAKQNKAEFDEERKIWKVDIKAPPEDGKANQEIRKYFQKLSGKKVKILTGATSKRKLLRFY
ncbi:MAG: DUF167 domain-containing protein [Candidatus Woesearchaeota archaeon]